MATTEKSGQLVSAQDKEQKRESLASMLVNMKPQIAAAIPQHLDPERMARVSMTALSTTPKLNLCSVPSFLGSVLQLAQLGLEPNTPLAHAYLVPYKVGGDYECKILLGYPGMLEVAYRSGKVALVYAEVVHEGDDFDYNLGLDRRLDHKATGDEDAKMTYAYAVAELTNGHKAFAVLTAKQIERRRKSAKGADSSSSPWTKYPEEMWKKSAVRQLFKYLPKSAELQQVTALDTATEHGVRQVEVLDERVTDALRAESIDLEENGEIT